MATNFTDFGDLVLLIGDYHIPQRESALPACFQDLLSTDKIRHVLCTGNLGNSQILHQLKALAGSVHIVRGDMDVPMLVKVNSNTDLCEGRKVTSGSVVDLMDFPEYKVVEIGEFRVGLVHGHQIIPWGDNDSLLQWQRRLGCDILVSGHTHQNSVSEIAGKFFINPGSATGAYQAFNSQPVIPSFMLMAVQGPNIVLYVYEERDGKANVIMSEFSKPTAPTAAKAKDEQHVNSLGPVKPPEREVEVDYLNKGSPLTNGAPPVGPISPSNERPPPPPESIKKPDFLNEYGDDDDDEPFDAGFND